MIFTFPQNLGFFGILIGVLLFYWIVKDPNIKAKKNDLKRLEQDYNSNPEKVFDLKDYPSLNYSDLVNYFGKNEINLIKD